MSLEEIVQRILSIRKDLTCEEVLTMIEKKKGEAMGYLTDEAAARIVATGLEVGGFSVTVSPPKVLIRDLISGLNDVTVVGRVIIVYPLRTFLRPDKTEGGVARLLIADKSGTLMVVLWDDKASLVGSRRVKQKQIVKLSHGYLREGRDGTLELHVGLRGGVLVSPPSARESDYPSIRQFIEKIAKITLSHKRANVLGIVQNTSPVKEFKRKDDTVGKVRRMQLRDESGQITVVFWNNKVDELSDAKRGGRLQIINSRVKRGFDGRLELHVEKATHVEILTGRQGKEQL